MESPHRRTRGRAFHALWKMHQTRKTAEKEAFWCSLSPRKAVGGGSQFARPALEAFPLLVYNLCTAKVASCDH